MRQEPRPCLSFSSKKSPKIGRQEAGSFHFYRERSSAGYLRDSGPLVMFIFRHKKKKKKYFAGSEGCRKWVLPKRVSSRWGNILPARKIKKMTPWVVPRTCFPRLTPGRVFRTPGLLLACTHTVPNPNRAGTPLPLLPP